MTAANRERDNGWIPPARHDSSRPPLIRATHSSQAMPRPILAGVCSGISVHIGLHVWTIRAICLLLCTVGIGILLYVWFAVTMQVDRGRSTSRSDGALATPLTRSTFSARSKGVSAQLLAAGLIAIGLATVLAILVALNVAQAVDIPAILASIVGLALVWSQSASRRKKLSALNIVLIAAGVAFFLLGIFALFFGSTSRFLVTRSLFVGVVLIGGLIFAVAPLWLRASTNLSATREQQVRDAERADIAAHLHDSVLQTLTLIRAHAQDPTRVSALALRQERELRSWLYTGHHEVSDSFAAALRESVENVESRYGVPIEVVSVGDCVPTVQALALVAATTEAATNAVRHGRPPVTIYAEVGSISLDVYVKDQGEGFDVDTIPDDRHGIRHSIIGRIDRVGGTVTIRRLSSGTEIHMNVPIDEGDAAPSETTEN
ncbi:MAG: ATP-binding protein [Actinomyces sp.]|nr:ATP-binding protein [Actinomyces sp.]